MKCPNCRSQMFITDETVNYRSQVTFYRCSICVGEYVSSEPVVETADFDNSDYFDGPAEEQRHHLTV